MLAKIRQRFYRRLPLQRQTAAGESGLVCISMIAGFHGLAHDFASLRHKLAEALAADTDITLAQLVQFAGSTGLNCRPLRIDRDKLWTLSMPAVLSWNSGHYVVLKGLRKDRLSIHDPAIGLTVLSLEEIASCFSGIAIEAEPREKFHRPVQPGMSDGVSEPDRLADRLAGPQVVQRPSFVPALLLTLVLAAIMLTGPFLGG